MADTRRLLADILTVFADNTAGDISANDLRDFVVSVYGADSLFTGATKTASFTAAVGQIYPVDVSAATANLDVTFPGSPVAGDTFGFYVAVSSTTAGGSGFVQAPYWGVEPLATTDINNVSFTQAAGDGMGKWGLMVVGEILIFRWDAVTSTWIVIRDGRIKYGASVRMSAAITTNTAATAKDLAFDTLIGNDPAGCHDATAKNIEIKRANEYEVFVRASPNSAMADSKYYIVGHGTVSVTFLSYAISRVPSSTASLFCNVHYSQLFSAGASVFGIFQAEETDRGASALSGAIIFTSMFIIEVLR